MYKSIRIQNFRGLGDLRIDDLGRVNLIVGANNVGKTSLLEALWLFQDAGNPSLTIDLARLRWHDPLPRTPELLWHGLFRDFMTRVPIRLEGLDADCVLSALDITLTKGGEERGVLNGQPFSLPETLRFRFSPGTNGQFMDTALTIVGAEVRGQSVDLPGRSGALLPADQHLTPEVMADRFTKIQDAERLESLVASLRTLDERLTDLSLGYNAAEGRPMIRAHLSTMNTPLPLNFLGGGSVRLAEILLTFFDTEGGIVLVDDVDDGIYARSLENAWRSLNEATMRSSVQLVATTHSWECVDAAVRAFRQTPHDFRIHRLERHGKSVRAVTYDYELAEVAVEDRVEVR
jgi:hypothetical protein